MLSAVAQWLRGNASLQRGTDLGAFMFKKLSAEFLGTFWLVFGGCGSAVFAAAFPDVGIGLLGVAFAFGSPS